MSLERTLESINIIMQEFLSLMPMSNESKNRLHEKYRLEFSYNSNHLEGNTLTYGETELLLLSGYTTGDHSFRELEEMKAHDYAYNLIEDWAVDKERPLTEYGIKELNKILLVRPFYKEALTLDGNKTQRLIKVGAYKEHPNSVLLPDGKRFEYASPIDTPILMAELIEWYKEVEDIMHPVELAALLHYKFVRIHPFDDGNGRVSRLLMNYILIKNGLPPVVIKSEDKNNYLRALKKADSGDLNSFTEYIANQFRWSLEIAIKAAKGLSIEEDDDWKKQLHLLKSELSKNEGVKAKRSTQVVRETLHDTVLPFLYKLKTEVEAFYSDLFLSITLHHKSANEGEYLFPDNETAAYDLLKSRRDLKNGWDVAIMFNTFRKNGKHTFSVTYHIEIRFDVVSFDLILIDENITKLYGSSFTEPDMQAILKNIGYNVIGAVRDKINHPNP